MNRLSTPEGRRFRRSSPFVASLVTLLTIVGKSSPVLAGPPFLTDDPEPVDYGHWEIDSFSMGTIVHGDAAGALPGVEINYGALPGVQLHVKASIGFNSQDFTGTEFGYGDSEIGVKYRFINPGDDDWWPQVAIYPAVDAPTGSVVHGLGTGATHAFLPLWMQKNFGKWSTYGGGGYWINPGPGNRNYWFLGWQVQRQVTSNLTMASDPACLFIDSGTPDGRATGVVRDCVVSCLVLVTVYADTIVQTLGTLSPTRQNKLDTCLKAAMALA